MDARAELLTAMVRSTLTRPAAVDDAIDAAIADGHVDPRDRAWMCEMFAAFADEAAANIAGWVLLLLRETAGARGVIPGLDDEATETAGTITKLIRYEHALRVAYRYWGLSHDGDCPSKPGSEDFDVDRCNGCITSRVQHELGPNFDGDRCPRCGWPFATDRRQGCVPGDCSYRCDCYRRGGDHASNGCPVKETTGLDDEGGGK